MMNWKAALTWRTQLDEIVGVVPQDQLCDLAGELARHTAHLNLRLNTHPQAAQPNGLDRQLTASEVSHILSVSKNWVYAHRRVLGGKKLGGSVRYSERSIRRYLAST